MYASEQQQQRSTSLRVTRVPPGQRSAAALCVCVISGQVARVNRTPNVYWVARTRLRLRCARGSELPARTRKSDCKPIDQMQ